MNRLNRGLLGTIRVLTGIYLVFMLVMLLHPDPWSLLGFTPQSRTAKSALSVVHIAIFVLLAVGVELGRTRFSVRFWLIALLLFGPLTELIQTQTGRGFEWLDIFQDSIGVFIGIGIGILLHQIPPFRQLEPENLHQKDCCATKNIPASQAERQAE